MTVIVCGIIRKMQSEYVASELNLQESIVLIENTLKEVQIKLLDHYNSNKKRRKYTVSFEAVSDGIKYYIKAK